MIAGAARCRRYRPGKAQIDKVQTVDKGIDDADKSIRSNIVSALGSFRTAWEAAPRFRAGASERSLSAAFSLASDTRR